MTGPGETFHAILAKSAATYSAAGALCGRASLGVCGKGAPDPATSPNNIDYAMGAGTDAFFDCDGFGGVTIGQRAFLFRSDMPDVYVATDLQVDLPTTMQSVLNSTLFLPPQIVMRAGRSMVDVIQSLGLGIVSDLEPVSQHDVTDALGSDTVEIRLQGGQGTITAIFDGAQGTLKRIRGRTGETEFDYSIECETVVPVESAVTFDARSRREISTFAATQGGPATLGKAVPDFKLPTTDGRSLGPADALGRFLVLDFWALWCGPCLQVLPGLDRLARKLTKASARIDIWTLAMVEDSDRTASIERIRKMWNDGGLTLPILIDRNGLLAQETFGIKSIPATAIVDAAGIVVAMEAGITIADLEHRLDALDLSGNV